MRNLHGVKGVTNMITIKPRVVPTDVKRRIEEALMRSAEVDAQRITVETRDGKVTLRGTVRSCAERQEAVRASWAAPGVSTVEDLLIVC